MALVKCWECDAQVSDTAEACPHCGAPSEVTKAAIQVSPSVSLSEGMDSELQAEMIAQATVSITRKKLLNSLQDKVSGTVLEKFFNAKGSGNKVFAQVYWKHFSIGDHSKDKSFETHVRKTTGSTSYGNRYVKDVEVSTTTTHYDFIEVHDKDGNKHNYRLTDCELSKLNVGQIVSLGWVNKANSALVEDQNSGDSWEIGQSWSDEIQPSIFVSHRDPKNGDDQNWEAVPSTKFEKSFISDGIGMWHFLWLVPLATLFLLPTELALIPSGVAIFTMITVKVSRFMKGRKQLKLFGEWYRAEADAMLAIGSETYSKII